MKLLDTIQQLHQMLKVQQQATDRLTDPITKITASMSSLEDITAQIFKTQQAQLATGGEKPIKRAKIGESSSSPTLHFKSINSIRWMHRTIGMTLTQTCLLPTAGRRLQVFEVDSVSPTQFKINHIQPQLRNISQRLTTSSTNSSPRFYPTSFSQTDY